MMESTDDLFLNLDLSLALKNAGILFDETLAIRHKDNGAVSLRKSMFTTIPTIHIPAPSLDELYAMFPKKIILDDMSFYLMTSVDNKYNSVSWFESEDDLMTDMITGDDLKTCLANQLLFLIKNELTNTRYINRAEWL
jgi:hypothetical protein